MNCHVCGHSINAHRTNYSGTKWLCWITTDSKMTSCQCTETPESIALHAVNAAVAEARELLKPFAIEGKEWSGSHNMADNNDIPTIKWKIDDDDENSLALFSVGDLRRAYKYLAAHPKSANLPNSDTQPQDGSDTSWKSQLNDAGYGEAGVM